MDESQKRAENLCRIQSDIMDIGLPEGFMFALMIVGPLDLDGSQPIAFGTNASRETLKTCIKKIVEIIKEAPPETFVNGRN